MRSPASLHRDRTRRRGPRRARDAASTHVLEAVLVASIMLSAVAFVVTFDVPPPQTEAVRDALELRAGDALKVLYDTPVNSPFGKNALSAYLAQCLNNDCKELETRLASLVPAGASYALYISNGYDTFPVLVEGTPHGEAVAASQAFEPGWSSTFLATATESVGTDDALLTYALPVFHSNPVTPGGSQLLVRMTGQRNDGSDYVLLMSAATHAQASTDPTAVGASLYFIDHDGDPLAVTQLQNALGSPRDFTLRLAATETGSIPIGTEVTVHMPRGWTASANPAQSGWTWISDADDANGAFVGSVVRAALSAPLPGGNSIDFTFDAVYQGDELDFYPFVATLSKGVTSTASIIVRGEDHGEDPKLATPMLLASVPAPMGKGEETIWTLSAYAPRRDPSPTEGPDPKVRVKEIEIIEKEGKPIFQATNAVRGIASMGGVWTNSPESLVWRGDVELDYERLLNLSFGVKASGTPGPSDARAAFHPPVTFDAHTGKLVERTGWGFSRQAILPENSVYKGYNRTSGVLGEIHPLVSDGVYRGTAVPGNIQYNVSAISGVRDSLYGSYVYAEQRTVPVGGTAVITANVQSMLLTLAEAGQRAGVTLRFYPPWSGDARIPIFTAENLDQGILGGNVTQMVVVDVNNDGFVDPVIGTSNGKVVAYHGLTGQRLQGSSWTAPLAPGTVSAGAAASPAFTTNASAAPAITALELVTLPEGTFIVVGTDAASRGVYVLDLALTTKWKYFWNDATDILAIDASVDVDGDSRKDIVVARSYASGASKNALVYAFRANSGNSALVPILAPVPPAEDANALYYSLGTPTDILAQPAVGPFGDFPGFLLPTQTNVEPGLRIQRATFPPTIEQGASSTPRAGLQAVNSLGEPVGTLFGAPATVLADYDYNGDAIGDVVYGGTSGYVIMGNGGVLTQPIYSYLVNPSSRIIAADTRSAVESYSLSETGRILYTDDAWVTNYIPVGDAVGGKAIAAPKPNHWWIVGSANKVWRTTELAYPEDPTSARHPETRVVEPVTIEAERVGLGYNFISNLHDFNDIHFRDDTGYIVGTTCLVGCTEAIMLYTFDGGERWFVLSSDDRTLTDEDGISPVTRDINAIEIFPDGSGIAVGDEGLVLRTRGGSPPEWRALPAVTTKDLFAVACDPLNLDECIVVGDNGAAFISMNARDEVLVGWDEITGEAQLPTDRRLTSVGYKTSGQIVVGAKNMVLMRFAPTANWTTLPMNYIENDVYAISTPGDGSGTGFIFGGSSANGRIWLLQDYHTESQAQTSTLQHHFDPLARIDRISLVDGNVTFALQDVVVNATTDGGQTWKTCGLLTPNENLIADSRHPSWPVPESGPVPCDWTGEPSGRDLRFRIVLNTTPDKTVVTPQVRSLKFLIDYTLSGNPQQLEITLDPSTAAQLDPVHTTAFWNTEIGAIHQPYVTEFWTRNVSGQVHDIRTGFNANADPMPDVWVATGDILSENSPDHIAYAGTNMSVITGSDNRVYLLDGRTGHPSAISQQLLGEVKQIRLASTMGTPDPEVVYAVAYRMNQGVAETRLYALSADRLEQMWVTLVVGERPGDSEVGRFADGDPALYVGTQGSLGTTQGVAHLWGFKGLTGEDAFKLIPGDVGKYRIEAKVEPRWLFGPYVVEVEVNWTEAVTGGSGPAQTVVRSARFYDHFMVAPPDLLSPPTPIYTARLLVWMNDWG